MKLSGKKNDDLKHQVKGTRPEEKKNQQKIPSYSKPINN